MQGLFLGVLPTLAWFSFSRRADQLSQNGVGDYDTALLSPRLSERVSF